jgi:hypothetical protein
MTTSCEFSGVRYSEIADDNVLIHMANRTNRRGHGIKGRSGRKGAGRELMDYQKLLDEWENPKVIAAIREKEQQGGKLSIRERFLLRAHDGVKERDAVMYKKLVPDNINLNVAETKKLIVLDDRDD